MAKKASFTLSKYQLSVVTVLADALEAARTQNVIELRPPGHIGVETRDRGGRYAYWSRFVEGKLARDYLGPENGDKHTAALAELEQLKRFQAMAKNLRGLGFASVEHDAALVVAELHNARVFAAGGVLIGTRAFGALLNQLGWKATPFLSTQDVDIARPKTLKLAAPLGNDGFLTLLRQTGLRFAPVVGLERPPGPSTSYKVVGKDLKIDLLVPSRLNSRPYATVPVPELGAHATALPFLEYLLEAPWNGVVIGREHLIPVMTPQPARYALHKLVIADLRSGADNPKVEKDLVQAGILSAILTQDDPSALEEAATKLTPTMRKHALKSLPRWLPVMGNNYANAAQLVQELLGG